MWNWEQFKQLPRIASLPAHEQSRQFFLYNSNRQFESAIANASASSSSAAAGAGGSGQQRVTPVEETMIYVSFVDRETNLTELMSIDVNTKETNNVTFKSSPDYDDDFFSGSTLFCKNTDDNLIYYINSPYESYILTLGIFDKDGTIINGINDNITLPDIGGKISNFTYESTITTGTDGNYIVTNFNNSGVGIEAGFNVSIEEGQVTVISQWEQGHLYHIGDILTISGTEVGGSEEENIIITITDIDEEYLTPNTFYYEGDNNFIFCEGVRFLGDDPKFQRIFRISTIGDVELIGVNDTIQSGSMITSLFVAENKNWTIITDITYPICSISEASNGIGSFPDTHVGFTLNNIESIENYKVAMVTSVTTLNNTIYAIYLILDKDTSYFSTHIGTLNIETFEGDWIYALSDMEWGSPYPVQLINLS